MDRVFVGVDWGFDHCEVFAENAAGKGVFSQRVATHPETLEAVSQALIALAGCPSEVHLGIEKATGRVVEHFLAAGVVVYNVNPAKVDQGRKLVSMSEAKDDRRDARVLSRLVRSFADTLRPLVPSDGLHRSLRAASRQREVLVCQETVLRNRIASALREYFPAMLEFGHLSTQWHVALLLEVPTPSEAQRVRPQQVNAILRRYRSRQNAREVLKILRRKPPVVDAHFVDALAFEVPMWAQQLQLITEQISATERRIRGLLQALQASQAEARPDELTEVEIVMSVPGIGDRTGASLFGEGLVALVEDNLRAARCVAGVAPVTETTGKRQTRRTGKVTMRRACNMHLRNALHHIAGLAAQNDPTIRRRYERLRQRGKSDGQARRTVADHLLRVLHAMLRDRAAYKAPSAALEPVDAESMRLSA